MESFDVYFLTKSNIFERDKLSLIARVDIEKKSFYEPTGVKKNIPKVY